MSEQILFPADVRVLPGVQEGEGGPQGGVHPLRPHARGLDLLHHLHSGV